MAEREENEEHTSSEIEESKILCMSKEMLPCKLLYLVMDACFSAVYDFQTLFYVTSGLSVSQVGLSNGMSSGFTLIAGPLWGGVVDMATKHRKWLFVALNLGTTALVFCKPWVVVFVSKTETIITCLDNTTVANTSFEQLGKNCTSSVHLLNPNILFYAVAINGVLSEILMSGLCCYTDGVIIKTVFTRKTEQSYGKQKVFTPIGYALGSLLAGIAVDHYKPKHLSPYTAAFYVYLPLSLMMIPFLYILTDQADWNYGRRKEGEKKTPIVKHAIAVFKKRDNLVFIFSVFIAGIASSTYGNYLFLFMDDVMKPTKTIMSLTTVAATVAELVIYPFSSKLIKLFGGPIRCVILGMFACCLRLVLLSYCTTPWYIFPIQLLQGIGMSLSWTAMVEHTWAIFPKVITTTAIGILVSVNFTGAAIISNVLGGFVYHKFGGACLFRGMAVLCGTWSIFMTLYFGIREKRTKLKCVPAENGISQDIDIEIEEGRTK